MRFNAGNNTILLFCLTFLFCGLNCSPKSESRTNLPPRPKTVVKANMEDGRCKDIKYSWLELLHKSGDLDWRAIEHETMLKKYEQYLKEGATKGGQVNIASGKLVGTWYEKGAKNQAGDIKRTAYSRVEDKLYAISSGGTMWKGDLDGKNWEVVDDMLRFDPTVLEINYDGGSQKLIAAMQGKLYFSDGGQLWAPVDDLSESHKIKDVVTLKGKEIFVLSQSNSSSNISLHRSTNFGKSFSEVKEFETKNLSKIAQTITTDKNNLYLIEYLPNDFVRTYWWNPNNNVLAERSTTFTWNSPTEARLYSSIRNNGEIVLYRNGEGRQFHETFNFGTTWLPLDDLNEQIWWDAFYISANKPDFFLMGRINPHYSQNAGWTWNKLSNFDEYYSDPVNKLHADLMQIKALDRGPGDSILAIANHGGIALFNENTIELENITLEGMTNAQYYDVVTHPEDPKWIFAGSQDQGWQRGRDNEDEAIEFDQVTSGDWGHLTFTHKNELWISYPNGEIHYYANPLTTPYTEESDQSYIIESVQESVWIPPIMRHPDPAFGNTIYAAGGNINGGIGSYMIQLKVLNNNTFEYERTQLPFDFAVSGGEISAMTTNPNNMDKWYVATTNGKFYYSDDRGANWEETNPQVPNSEDRYGSDIYVSKTDENTIYVCGSGYNTKPIVRSLDGGKTFEDFSNGLPPTAVFEIDANEEENIMFAATEAGPYVYIRSTNRWHDLAKFNAPNQRYWSVEFLPEIQTARFGTFGRGVWDFKIELEANTAELQDFELNIYPNPSSTNITFEAYNSEKIIGYEVYRTNGSYIFGEEITPTSSKSISVSELETGIYLLRLKTREGYIFKQFMKI